jgi:hypothetical protein
MQSGWCCVDCVSEIDLDTHGRCGTCGSDAVDRITRNKVLMNPGAAVPVSIQRKTSLTWLTNRILTLPG